MLSVHDLEIRVGARLLMEGVTFRVDKGDKIGLVGRNGAGKTTMTKTLAGETKSQLIRPAMIATSKVSAPLSSRASRFRSLVSFGTAVLGQ